MHRLVYFILGVAALLLSLGSMVLPIPLISIFFFAISVAFFVMVSETARMWVLKLRGRYDWLDRGLKRIEKHLPAAMQKALKADPVTQRVA